MRSAEMNEIFFIIIVTKIQEVKNGKDSQACGAG